MFIVRFQNFCFALAALALAAFCGCATNKTKGVSKRAGGDPSPIASGLYEPVSDQALQSYAHFAAGLSFDLRNDSNAALEEYSKAVERDPSQEPLSLEVARRLLRNNEPAKAITILTNAARAPNASGIVDTMLGMAYSATSDTNKAIGSFRAAIGKMPLALTAYGSLSQLYLQAARTNDAVAVLGDAAKQNDAAPEFYLGVAELVLRMQARDAVSPEQSKKLALTVLDKAFAQNPSDLSVRTRLGDSYLFHGETAKAETIYAKLYEEQPLAPSVREKLVNIYLRTNKEKASKMLEEIRGESPTDPRPHILLGQIAIEGERYDEALQHFERAVLLSPGDEQLWFRVAALQVSIKKADEAIALMEKARARFKLTFELEFYTGLAHMAKQTYTNAVKYFGSAELIAKTSAADRLTHNFYFQFGSACERAGDIEQAVKHFRRALELEPDFAEALNYLGYMWAERGENLEEAHKMIERAVKAEPQNAAFLDSMAWVLFKMKRHSAALDYMRKAIEYSEEKDATLYDHLGDILAALKRPAEARDAWEKALKIEPKDEIRRKLEAGA